MSLPLAGLIPAIHSVPPAPADSSAPAPRLPLPLAQSAEPPVAASGSLALSNADSPGTAPAVLAHLTLLANWRTLRHLASLRPPAICLSSPTPPG